MNAAVLAAEFHPPSTKDFVFDCFFSFKIGPIDFCINFIIALVFVSALTYFLLFFFAFRKPKVVPGSRSRCRCSGPPPTRSFRC